MPNTPDTIFRTLADPTRRAIFERLVSKTHYLAEPRALKQLIDSLRPSKGGTLPRVEQSGFGPEQTGNCQGANYGWQKYLSGLERVLAAIA